MVFKAKFLTSDFEVTICTLPAKGAVKGTVVYSAFIILTIALHKIGVHLLACVNDGAQPNVTFWNKCGIRGETRKDKIFNNKMLHPARISPLDYEIFFKDHPEMFIFFFRCAVHLMKCLSNYILK